MVYLGPIEFRNAPVSKARRLAPTSAVRPLNAISEDASQDLTIGDAVDNVHLAPEGRERRKSSDDRRAESRNAMLETRTGGDRRKSKRPSISISI